MRRSVYRCIFSTLVATAAVMSGSVARGAIFAQDGFESYSVGSLPTNSGGTGWSGSWGGLATTDVVAPGLVANGVNGGNRSIQFDVPVNNNAAYRSLATPINSDDVFFSFLFEFDAGSISSNNFMGF